MKRTIQTTEKKESKEEQSKYGSVPSITSRTYNPVSGMYEPSPLPRLLRLLI